MSEREELEALASGLAAAARRRRELSGELRLAGPRPPRPPAAQGTSGADEGCAPETISSPVPPGRGAPRPAAGRVRGAGGQRPAEAPGKEGPGAPAASALFAAREVSPEARANAELARSCADLASLREAVAACRACALCETRTQTVFVDGTGRAGVMFVGEAPGQQEDERGVPFVGPAGRLLTDIITKGMGLAREDVAIANVLKCRPPGNRDPEPDEKERCTPFLDRQIELLDPRVLILLGLHAAQHVLGTTDSIGRLRGRVHEREGRRIVVTYHPAYLLRSPGRKKDCWADIQLAMRELGLPLPAPGGSGGEPGPAGNR